MISHYLFVARAISRKLWVRAALISVLAIISAFVTPLFAPLFPENLLVKVQEDTVRSLLDILANSMLAVTTFSLTVMVTAHLNASQQVTPRSHRILRQDTRTQTVLATFIGAFVFSLTAIVMLQLDLIEDESYAVLYVFTLFVVALVTVGILRWIGHLASLGSVEETTRKVQEQAAEALKNRVASPFLGGHRWRPPDESTDDGASVSAPSSGYVQHIDTAQLNTCAEEIGCEVYITAMPGHWVGEGDALALLATEHLTEEGEKKLREAFTIGDTRTFMQDADFGIMCLSEIAERALSPSMNDPKTATDVIARMVLLLEEFETEVEPDEVDAPRVYAPPLDVYELVERGFDPIARDGKAFAEIQMHLQIALGRLARHRDDRLAEAARIVSGRALAYAETGLLLAADIARVRELAVAPRAASITSG